jgi:hypothetical protein
MTDTTSQQTEPQATREVDLSFAVEAEGDIDVSVTAFVDATFFHAGPHQIGETWCLKQATCRAVVVHAGACHTCLSSDDYTDWLREWLNTRKKPVVMFRRDWERLSQSLSMSQMTSLPMRNYELWEIVNEAAAANREHDKEARADEWAERSAELRAIAAIG